MDQFGVSELADWLEAHAKALLEKKEALPIDRIFEAVDSLSVLKHKAESYRESTQDAFFKEESDHKLNLDDYQAPLFSVQDRIMVNHVDGSITNDELNFTYNHEPVFDPDYSAKKDLNIVKYGLEVIGAVASSGHNETVTAALSTDAVLTLLIASATFADWQK